MVNPSNSSKQKTIFISAYRNVSIRYILYTDIFKELKKSGARIVLFLKDNDLEYYKKKFSDPQLIFEPILFSQALRSIKKPLNRLFIIIRKCMSGRSETETNTTDKVRILQYRDELSRSIRGRIEFLLVRVLAYLGSRFLLIRKFLVGMEGVLSRGEIYDNYFNKYRPDLLIVSSIGFMIDPLFMRAAKRHSCKVISIIHSWDNPTTKDYRGAMPDRVVAWNALMKKEVAIFHDIQPNRIFEAGIAHWDIYFNGNLKPLSKTDFCQKYNLDPEKKIIFYGTSSPVMFRRTFDVIRQILDAIAKNKIHPEAQLLVRLHPNYFLQNNNGSGSDNRLARIPGLKIDYGEILSFCNPIVVKLNDDFDLPREDLCNLGSILYHADLLLTEYSTLMIEASIFNLPIINVGLYNYRDTDRPISIVENFTHIKRMLRTKAAKNAYSMEELIDYTNRYLQNPAAEKEERLRLKEQEITANPANAGYVIGRQLVSYFT